MTATVESVTDQIVRLPADKMKWVNAVRKSSREETALEETMAAVRATKSAHIANAVENGVPVALLAQMLGLSKSRIYQIRDEVVVQRSQFASTDGTNQT